MLEANAPSALGFAELTPRHFKFRMIGTPFEGTARHVDPKLIVHLVDGADELSSLLPRLALFQQCVDRPYGVGVRETVLDMPRAPPGPVCV